ncbi:chromosome segregation protein SMC [Limosilactobacillus fastidiosus]|uniref:Chromosome partition protein Smc n=1 Tax=Limosilactobacillus fastidiosus TaxID=2759855 RepID=A0A7W3U0K8_9LACO|nr:chromosome segregation protein SMC [Limosilactobacillus fastidiosus]MBB1086707.1 chromosome segregation protein SMC [Limosilactobacillus fastidiosus]MCD7085566.1 chromosome segregation protein SMC [Limosilactobacillus fastidiosus]MCD7114797.1 chromosome segregation protein SMC [Limosilactobacillus fastidiosus]MCD7115954.1 chromosome segregation protein SMC [Limosilactobacillus fastidiosus]
MRLLSLTLDGFKSFAQKTTIKFKPGMTGIVGPNGSGKSNIIEAIRWVMGEQSAHQLRGDKMADVIFNGSNDRKPLNRALVSITFDNSDHYLASDFTELTITRKLYRNGDSEYLVNGQEVRLKDITDLFIDSGLGRESFSVISQGQIEAIFNGKPADRRSIIETVAGVAKYKKNKDTAEKRLGLTMDNLNRVNDIIAELTSQLEPLADESALAEDYLEQKGQYDLLDRTQTVHLYDQTDKSLVSLKNKLENDQRMVDNYRSKLTKSTVSLNKLKEQQTSLQSRKDQLQAKILTSTEMIGKLQNQQSVSSIKREQQVQERERLAAQLKKLQDQQAAAVHSLSQVNDQIRSQEQAIASHHAELTAAKQMSSSQRIQHVNEQLEKLRGTQVDLMQQITTFQNQQAFLKSNHEQTVSAQQQSNAELQSARERLNDVEGQEKNAQKKVGSYQEQVTTLRKRLETQQSHQGQLQEKYQEAQRSWYRSLGDVHSLQSRIKNYQSMQEEYSGYYQGVQNVLKQRQQFTGLEGAVNELFDVPDKYTTAIETVLGSQLQQLVVDQQSTAKQIINYLVRRRAGRVTILPLNTLKHRQSSSIFSQLDSLPGYIGRATDLIKYADKYEVVAQHLLGNTVVVDNLDHATAISRHGHHYVRIVTLDGQLINASGAMTGGANRHQRIGLLSQKQLANQLQGALTKEQLTAGKLEKQVAQLQNEQKTIGKQIQELQSKLHRATEQLHSASGQEQVLQTQRQALERQVSALEFQSGQQGHQHGDYEQQLTKNDQKLTDAQRQFDVNKQQIAELQEQVKQLQNDESAQSQQLHQMEQWIAVAKERLQQIQNRRHDLKYEKQTLQINIEHLKDQLQQLNLQINSNHADNESNESALHDAKQQLGSAKQQSTTIKKKLVLLDEQVTTAETEHDRLRELLAAATNERNQLDAQRVRQESQMDNYLNHLSSQYSMTINEARKNISDLPDDQLKIKLKLLKRGLDDLGEVNTGAITEYKRVKERYDFLSSQQADLLASRDRLNETMSEMDQQVKERFNKTFKKVSAAFDQTFQQIFAGGHARLVLTEPHDLLTTGIDIMAQPPGKKNQRMSLLSGGEKALTAITLLFAILKVRPVPFAILDEPEAALDEVNVQRFANYLSHFGNDGPQFIVITHRKGTMMNANVLYGVTMQESGVSRMVSVDVIDTLERSND